MSDLIVWVEDTIAEFLKRLDRIADALEQAQSSEGRGNREHLSSAKAAASPDPEGAEAARLRELLARMEDQAIANADEAARLRVTGRELLARLHFVENLPANVEEAAEAFYAASEEEQ